MKLELKGGFLYFISQTPDEEKILFNLSDSPGENVAFMMKTGVKSLGYQARNARTEAPNRIFVDPNLKAKVVEFMISLGLKIEN